MPITNFPYGVSSFGMPVAGGGYPATSSYVLLTGDTIACNCTKIATATGVFNGTPARVATATIAIQAT